MVTLHLGLQMALIFLFTLQSTIPAEKAVLMYTYLESHEIYALKRYISCLHDKTKLTETTQDEKRFCIYIPVITVLSHLPIMLPLTLLPPPSHSLYLQIMIT